MIIGKPERKLKKGCGIHLDIVLVCLINIICGIFGFPWLCGAAVRSIVHTSALTVMSRTHAPGEKPHLIEVKEQRLSALVVSICIGKITIQRKESHYCNKQGGCHQKKAFLHIEA